MRILLCPRAGQAIQKTRVGNRSDISKFLFRDVWAAQPWILWERHHWKAGFWLGDTLDGSFFFFSKDVRWRGVFLSSTFNDAKLSLSSQGCCLSKISPQKTVSGNGPALPKFLIRDVWAAQPWILWERHHWKADFLLGDTLVGSLFFYRKIRWSSDFYPFWKNLPSSRFRFVLQWL